MNESWARSQERKRNAVSTVICASIYAAVLVAIWLLGMTNIKELAEYSGPIQIKIGSPEGVADSAFLSGQEEGQAQSEVAPDESSSPDNASPEEKSPDDAASKDLIGIESPSPSPDKPSPKPSVSPKPSPSPKPSVTPRPSASTKPSPSSKPSAIPTISPSASPGAGTGGSTGSKPGAAVIKGSEQGNSYETNFEQGSSGVGRGLYVPIYLYLPLPYYINPEIYNGMKASGDGFTSAESRKSEFRKYYKLVNGMWQRKEDSVPYDDRPRIWILLNESGYKISQADYKENKSLRPVVIEFQVGAQKGDEIPLLESVKVLNSSGYSDIDDSVVYGFKKASFYNNSPKRVTGRFTYSFD